jgi:SulP family sulfate permease
MISAATGAMALLMVTLVREHGLQYLFAATVLTGVLQIIAGWIRLGELMRFVSRSVVTGFVNALAILIFMAQLPELIDVPYTVYVMAAAGLAIIYGFPYVTRMVPSPLIAIVLLTTISIYFGIDVRTVGDMGDLPSTLPVFLSSRYSSQHGDATNSASVCSNIDGGGIAGISYDRDDC